MTLEFINQHQQLIITLSGDLRHYDNREQIALLQKVVAKTNSITFDAQNLQSWDSALAAIIYQLVLCATKRQISVELNTLPADLCALLELALAVDRKPAQRQKEHRDFLEYLGDIGITAYDAVKKSLTFLHELTASLGRFVSGKAIMRRIDFEFALEDCGYKAIGIVSLVSFMVGLILAFVGALQLKMFGAQIYIASLVTIGMIRIMGAIMAGIIMAGRTGASYAATIGTMQVNEEIDALKTLGFSVSDFLVLPRVLSLMIAMPFLTILADIMGIIGGAFVSVVMLDISALQYWQYSIETFSLSNFLVGVFHGLVYGFIISCCGCYYGVNCGRNADSVGLATTKAVVSSIVIMIVTTGLLTFVFEVLGI